MINVKFFSSLRELTGKADIELRIQSPLTLREVWQQTTAADSAMPANTLCAINMEYARLDDIAYDNDEVAFFPPVTGG
jgi:molybdopterin converting factor subunit 1